jgi:FHS family L-fucose permease-like MFS transporter
MVQAIVGGALLPVLQGRIADKIGIQHAFIIPVVCYIYIAFFGFASRNRLVEQDLPMGDPV